MITASIYRTDPKQIEEKGAIAWRPMTFNAAAASVWVRPNSSPSATPFDPVSIPLVGSLSRGIV